MTDFEIILYLIVSIAILAMTLFCILSFTWGHKVGYKEGEKSIKNKHEPISGKPIPPAGTIRKEWGSPKR